MKKFFVLTLVLIMSFVYFPFTSSMSATESPQERKNVTLIYDDSGSMWYTFDRETNQRIPGDHWKLANYALQGLTALLGENDLLNVVRMSDEDNVDQVGLSYNERQQEIERVLNWNESGMTTPFETVHTSLTTIMQNMEENPEDDYWFIIVMDGAFNELDWEATVDLIELEQNYTMAYETLRDFKNEVDQMEVSFHSMFVTMEAFLTDDEVVQMTRFKEDVWDTTFAGQHLQAETEQEIIDRLTDVAATITNRDPFSEQTNVLFTPQVNGNEVTLQSMYPLKRITVLQQVSGTEVNHKITHFSIEDMQDEFSINGPFQMESPYDPNQLRDTIYGAVSHIGHTEKGGVIPEGTYTLTFEESIDILEYQFIAEPAIDFDISLKRVVATDSLSDDPASFYHGATMNMLVQFTERGGANEVFNFSSDKALSNVEVTVTIDNDDYSLIWDTELKAFQTTFTMPTEATTAVVNGQIKGFYQEEKEYTILGGVSPRSWELTPNHEERKYDINEIPETGALSYTLYVDDSTITKEELTAIFSNMDVTVEENALDIELVQDGSDILINIKKGSVGEWNVTLNIYNPNEGVELSVIEQVTITKAPVFEKSGVYLLYLLGFILLIYVVGIIKTNRFGRQAYIIAARSQLVHDRKLTIAERKIPLRTSFLKRWFIPYTSEKKVISGLVFKAASSKENVLLAKESQQEGMWIQGESLDEVAGEKNVPIGVDDVMTREVGYVEETYSYFRK